MRNSSKSSTTHGDREFASSRVSSATLSGTADASGQQQRINGAERGFLAISRLDSSVDCDDLREVVCSSQIVDSVRQLADGLGLVTWGIGETISATEQLLLLSRGPRCHDVDLTAADISELLRKRDPSLAEILPPFAAIHSLSDGSLLAVSDALGFRQLYYCQGGGWAAISTSARALAICAEAEVDREAIAVQSLLGWQVGQRTMFRGVLKCAPRSFVTLQHGQIVVDKLAARRRRVPANRDTAVSVASDLLRNYLKTYLDDHPDASLQLSGGLDSRILLAAIPPQRRKDLKVLTVGSTDSPDVMIAASLAARYEMDHQIVPLDGLRDLTEYAAYELCLQSAFRLECMADPLALALVTFAESKMGQGPRLSGVGGEIARGVYYHGPAVKFPVTRSAVRLLAGLHMFPRDSASKAALEPAFSSWARSFTIDNIYDLMSASRTDLFSATDDFFLGQEVQRWAGANITAACFDREIVNPLLDNRFLEIVQDLPARDKQNSRFLCRVLMNLDPELADIPLDGRPAPSAFGRPSIRNSVQISAMKLRKIAVKVRQRMNRASGSAAGTEVFAEKVVEFWRKNPGEIESIRNLAVFRAPWLDGVLSGTIQPDSSSVALLVNLVAAQHS